MAHVGIIVWAGIKNPKKTKLMMVGTTVTSFVDEKKS